MERDAKAMPPRVLRRDLMGGMEAACAWCKISCQLSAVGCQAWKVHGPLTTENWVLISGRIRGGRRSPPCGRALRCSRLASAGGSCGSGGFLAPSLKLWRHATGRLLARAPPTLHRRRAAASFPYARSPPARSLHQVILPIGKACFEQRLFRSRGSFRSGKGR